MCTYFVGICQFDCADLELHSLPCASDSEEKTSAVTLGFHIGIDGWMDGWRSSTNVQHFWGPGFTMLVHKNPACATSRTCREVAFVAERFRPTPTCFIHRRFLFPSLLFFFFFPVSPFSRRASLKAPSRWQR